MDFSALNGVAGTSGKDLVRAGLNIGKVAGEDRTIYNMIMAQREPSANQQLHMLKKCEDVGVPIQSIADVPACINALGDNIDCNKKNLLGSVAVFWIMFVLVVLLAALVISGEIGARVWDRMKKRHEASENIESVYTNTHQ